MYKEGDVVMGFFEEPFAAKIVSVSDDWCRLDNGMLVSHKSIKHFDKQVFFRISEWFKFYKLCNEYSKKSRKHIEELLK